MMYYINYVFLMAGLTDNSNLISSSIQCELNSPGDSQHLIYGPLDVINVVMTVPGLFLVRSQTESGPTKIIKLVSSLITQAEERCCFGEPLLCSVRCFGLTVNFLF